MLKPRLYTILELVEKTGTIVDVGTDHAYLSIAVAKSEKVDTVIACDINDKPLSIASKNIKASGPGHKIKVRTSDGLLAIEDFEANAAVIAGMGGDIIIKILSDSVQLLKHFDYFILQPQRATDKVRSWLFLNNFYVADDIAVEDSGKYYEILLVKYGANRQKIAYADLQLGLSLDKRSSVQKKDDYIGFLKSKYAKIYKSVSGLEASVNSQTSSIKHEIEKKKTLLRQITDILESEDLKNYEP